MHSLSLFRSVTNRYGLVLACVATLASAAQAQTGAVPAQSAAKSMPEVPQFTSAFQNYKAFREQPVGDWKKANDEVGRIGGWRAYAREANEAEPPASQATPPTPADKPAPMHPHAGHAKP